MNPPNCPGCSAPLDPLATKCPYCNVVTPKGRDAAEHADHAARAQQAHAHAYSAAQASMAQATASQEVARSANYALIATLVGLVTCCSPVGWVGAFFAHRSLATAGKHGIPKPATAILAAVLAGLGTLITVGVFVGSHFDQKDKAARASTLEARCEAGRKKTTLDAKTACDVTEAYLLRSNKMTSSGAMVCTGSPTVSGATARLDGVAVTANGKTDATYRVCLAKSARWFVVHLDTSTDECLDEAPQASNETEEQVARDAYATLVEKARVKGADKRLASAKVAVDRASPGEKPCDPAAFANAKDKGGAPDVRAIDYAVLDGKSDSDFAFLSDKDLLGFFTKAKATAKEKTDLAQKLSQGVPFVVVYRHKTRSFPEVTDKLGRPDYTLVPGDYEGTLYLVDTSRTEVVCQGPIAWKTPSKGAFSISRKSTLSAVKHKATTDYEQRFQDAATERMKALTSGKLRLGYKPLE